MSPATETQVKVLSILVFELSGKRLSEDYRLKLLQRSQGDLTRLIKQARERITPSDRALDTSMPAPSPQEVLDGRSPKGAWTKKQLESWGVPWPPPQGWRAALEQRHERERRSTPMALEEMK